MNTYISTRRLAGLTVDTTGAAACPTAVQRRFNNAHFARDEA